VPEDPTREAPFCYFSMHLRGPTMKIDPTFGWTIGLQGKSTTDARRFNYILICVHLLCVHLWAKKSCFVGHERLHGGAEPPFSSITVLAQPLANSLLESFLLVPHDPAQQAHKHPSRGTRMGLSVQRAT
jgi:hypothetical protein